ncbi:MAG: alanine--tRNA ligase-related protein, partial [Bacillota bacterium]|nr:alanine--tRNA ligase-related protein [Bacillota bacterium]
MRGSDLRKLFLDYFVTKGHKILPSASLIPAQDLSILWTAAGMVPFKPFFTGAATPEHRRATTCQKCLRTPDIEMVGRTARHHTFFEMLGNFSFGDYFKNEAIGWAWEFVTEKLGLDPVRLWISVYTDDDEAYDIWTQTGVAPDRIVRLGKDTNFWEIGVGPCGPCSEIYYDLGPERSCADPECRVGCECDRYLEIWNLVFIQFFRNEEGEYSPLEKKGIDTGMGLERVAAVLQGVESNFDTDLFQEIIDATATVLGVSYGADRDTDIALKVIADHARATTFA